MTHQRSLFMVPALVAVLVMPAFVPVSATAEGQRGAGPIAAPATRGAGAGGTRGRSGAPPTEKTPATAAVTAANERIKKINKAVAALDKAALRTAPKNLSEADHQQWSAVGSWIVSAKGRYAAHAQALTKATHTVGDDMDVLGAISALDDPFLTLQDTVQQEAAKFTDLAKAAKSRYDAAMSAISGIK